ncbi:hypothetical protein ACS0TY_005641 [Phlomoides rotata]
MGELQRGRGRVPVGQDGHPSSLLLAVYPMGSAKATRDVKTSRPDPPLSRHQACSSGGYARSLVLSQGVGRSAGDMKGLVKVDPAYDVKYVIEHADSKYNYTITYQKVWQALKRARENVYGTWESSCQFLPKYMGALQRYNPGTIVEWDHKERVDGVFTLGTIEYALTYTSGFFAPLADVEDWGEPNFQLRHNPARMIRRRGRDVTTRIHNEMDWAQTRARKQYQAQDGAGTSAQGSR